MSTHTGTGTRGLKVIIFVSLDAPGTLSISKISWARATSDLEQLKEPAQDGCVLMCLFNIVRGAIPLTDFVRSIRRDVHHAAGCPYCYPDSLCRIDIARFRF